MNIRRARITDIEKIKDLLNQVLTVHHNGRPDLFKPNCRKYTDSELAALIADEQRPIFAAEDDGEILGYAFCVIKQTKNDNILTDIKTLYIDDLCVDETVRGKHVGTALYEYVKKYAKEIGCYNLTLNVWACNENAAAFYEKQGLKPQKTTLETIL
jgi:ribosomal protein S18 acetylase RimI-like enzyme